MISCYKYHIYGHFDHEHWYALARVHFNQRHWLKWTLAKEFLVRVYFNRRHWIKYTLTRDVG